MPKRTPKQRGKGKRGESAAACNYIVFISHSSYDLWIAKMMAEKVSALGAEPWLDEKDLEGGDVIPEKIIRGIDASHEAIVLLSPKSIKSQWVAFEIGAARGQHKRVTPVLNNVGPEAMAPMKSVKAIELNEFEKYLIQLKKRMGSRSKNRK